MIFQLENEYDARKSCEWLRKQIAGKKVVEMKVKHPVRSIPQNKYYQVCVSYFASQYGCGTNEVKEIYFKRQVNADIFLREHEVNGRVRQYARSSADLTTAEMALAIDRFRNWSASEGIYIASSEEHKLYNHMLQEIERNKEFVQQVE